MADAEQADATVAIDASRERRLDGPPGYRPLPEQSILWTVIDTHPAPLSLLWGVRWTLDNGQPDLGPLSPVERRDLAVLLETVVDHIEREGM